MMKRRVLIVEDDVHINLLLSEILEEECGYYVESASNGLEGFKRYSEGNFDLIVSDLKMPEMDGDEFLRKVRTMDDRIRLIMISGYGGREKQEELKAIKCEFFEKPFDILAFVKVIGGLV